MARICDMCGKGSLKGNKVSFSNKKSIKKSQANLRSMRVSVRGTSGKLKVCTSCLSKIKMAKADSSKTSVVAA